MSTHTSTRFRTFFPRRAQRSAEAYIQMAAAEARFWAGSTRERSRDAEIVSTVQAGRESLAYRRLVNAVAYGDQLEVPAAPVTGRHCSQTWLDTVWADEYPAGHAPKRLA